jgi:D-alanyl-lipoteichoic acid acyltransferase DltB (MBOAT superfamily)
VAGPILRAHEIVPQLENYRRPTAGEVVHGLEEILQGLFKKLALADTIAQIVDEGFKIPVAQLGTLDIWTLAFAFGFQIYFDFSGYSQIALGSARVMGFHFPPNFMWPYLAVSPREFWNRWHISLSSWIRDYLYVPLQGVEFRRGERGLGTEEATQASEGRRTFALFATWFIMGLWHGANWTFAIWGLWHATMVYLHRVTEPLRTKLPTAVRTYGGWLVTLPMAMLGWIYFRCQDVGDATRMVLIAFDPTRLGVRAMRENDYLVTFLFLVGFLAVAGAVALSRRLGDRGWGYRYPILTTAHAVIFVCVFLLLGQLKSFIYFQF